MVHHETHAAGSQMRDIILGWQDGLVNVLGIILAVAAATNSVRIVLIAGLAATFAESISMAAVGYTSTKAYRSYYKSQVERELHEIDNIPEVEKKEIEDIYYKKGFRGDLLKKVVDKITSNKKVWLETMMREELNLTPGENVQPLQSGLVIGFSAIVGSLFPLIPFFFLPVGSGMIASVILSLVVLFSLGVVKAKLTTGKMWKSGLEISVIGIVSAFVGYGIGVLLGIFV